MLKWAVLSLYLAIHCFAGTPEIYREMVRRSLELREENVRKLKSYSLVRKSRKIEYDSDGKLRNRESWTVTVDWIDGVRVARVTLRNGKPLEGDELRQVEEEVRKEIAERKSGTRPQSQFEQDEEYLKEVPDAVDFRLVGTEVVGGRECWVLAFHPRRGYQPKQLRSRILQKVRGRVWIDKLDGNFSKVDVEVFDTVNYGFGILAKIEKGTRVQVYQAALEPGLWAPRRLVVNYEVRVMLIKSVRHTIETVYTDYRKRGFAPDIRAGQ